MFNYLQKCKSVVDVLEIDSPPRPRAWPADPVLQEHGGVDRVRVHPDLVPDVRGEVFALETIEENLRIIS